MVIIASNMVINKQMCKKKSILNLMILYSLWSKLIGAALSLPFIVSSYAITKLFTILFKHILFLTNTRASIPTINFIARTALLTFSFIYYCYHIKYFNIHILCFTRITYFCRQVNCNVQLPIHLSMLIMNR